jgi:hypothetical protein
MCRGDALGRPLKSGGTSKKVAQSCTLSVSQEIVSFREDFQRALVGEAYAWSSAFKRLLLTTLVTEPKAASRNSILLLAIGCGFAAVYRRIFSRQGMVNSKVISDLDIQQNKILRYSRMQLCNSALIF